MTVLNIKYQRDLSDRFIVIECPNASEKRRVVQLYKGAEATLAVVKRIADGYDDAQSLCKSLLKQLEC